LMKWQLGLWFVGMMVTTLPWHFTGLLGMPRRMSYFDYSNPQLHPQAITVTISSIGGLLLVASGLLFIWILATTRARGEAAVPPYSFSRAVHMARVPAALNGFALWIGLMIGLTVVNYGFPIVQLALLPEASVPVIRIGGPR
jgi:cytochrome c oxidase subunit I